MNAFQILDKEGNAISIKALDAEAAEFWGKEEHPEYYASPAKREKGESEFAFISREMSANWFDQLGWKIANQGNYYKKDTWKNVIHSMLDVSQYLMEEVKEEQPIEISTFDFVSYSNSEPESTVKISRRLAIGLYVKLEYVKPYVDLVNHWMAKGYTPKQIEG